MRHIPISEIARAFHSRSNPWKAMALLTAYFDDSGTDGLSPVTTISGWLASADDWQKCEIAWLEILDDYRPYGVTWSHFTDILNWQNEWRGVPLDACRVAANRFASCLGKQTGLIPIWAAVVNEDFHKFATPEFLQTHSTPFELCFHEAMHQLYWWSKHNFSGTKVAPFVAHGPYGERLRRAHQRYRSRGDFSALIGPIAFDEPREVIPLQCADLLANQFCSYWIETEYPKDPRSFRTHPHLDAALAGKCAQFGGCYSSIGMEAAVKRFMTRISASEMPGPGGQPS